jgi:hypothetical protein
MRKCPELKLGYISDTGELWRLSADGQPRRLLSTWTANEGKGCFVTSPVGMGNLAFKQATHCIFYIMMHRWPRPGMFIDHIDGDVTNNRWSNLREVTPQQNRWNTDTESTRWRGIAEGLQQGVKKVSNRYGVIVNRVYYGTYCTKEEANAVALKVQTELYGAYSLNARQRRQRRTKLLAAARLDR